MSTQKCTQPVCVNTLKLFGDFWTLRIIDALEKADLRYCEIERTLGDTNPVTLANRLQKLEQANIINKKQDSGQAVRYTLTTLGKEALPILLALEKFSKKLTTRK